jgi:hypothetical protein
MEKRSGKIPKKREKRENASPKVMRIEFKREKAFPLAFLFMALYYRRIFPLLQMPPQFS